MVVGLSHSSELFLAPSLTTCITFLVPPFGSKRPEVERGMSIISHTSSTHLLPSGVRRWRIFP